MSTYIYVVMHVSLSSLADGTMAHFEGVTPASLKMLVFTVGAKLKDIPLPPQIGMQ